MIHTHTARAAAPAYLDGPAGILTRSGFRFSIREKALEEVCLPLEKHLAPRDVVETAEAALISSNIIPAYVLLGLSLTAGLWIALVGSLAVALFWHAQKSAFTGRLLQKAVAILKNDILFVLAGVATLSPLGRSGEYLALSAGMLFFLAFKFGWLTALFDTIIWKEEGAQKLNDRVLAMTIRKEYVRYGIKTDELYQMEERLQSAFRTVQEKWSKK